MGADFAGSTTGSGSAMVMSRYHGTGKDVVDDRAYGRRLFIYHGLLLTISEVKNRLAGGKLSLVVDFITTDSRKRKRSRDVVMGLSIRDITADSVIQVCDAANPATRI